MPAERDTGTKGGAGENLRRLLYFGIKASVPEREPGSSSRKKEYGLEQQD